MASIADIDLTFSGGVSNDQIAASLGGLKSISKIQQAANTPAVSVLLGVNYLDAFFSDFSSTLGSISLDIHAITDTGELGLQIKPTSGATWGDYVDVTAGGNFCVQSALEGAGKYTLLVNVDTGTFPLDETETVVFPASTLKVVPEFNMYEAATRKSIWACYFVANNNLVDPCTVRLKALIGYGKAKGYAGYVRGAGLTDTYVQGEGVPAVASIGYDLVTTGIDIVVPAGSSRPVWVEYTPPVGAPLPAEGYSYLGTLYLTKIA